MARIRTIKPEFFTSEDIVELAPLARLLYIALWCEADKEGRLAWKPKTFKMRYLPADACDIEEICDSLVGADLVRLYGDGLAYIPTFSRHQHVNPRESKSVLPVPDDADPTLPKKVTQTVRLDVFERDGHKCVRCGATENLTLDHILPQSAGGPHIQENLRVMCKSCNSGRPVSGNALENDLASDGYTISGLRARFGIDASRRVGTREDHDLHVADQELHCASTYREEGKGRERKGKEGKDSSSEQSPDGQKPRRRHGSEDDHAAARWIFDRVRRIDATAKEPNWDAWANDVRLMREIDGHDHKSICEMFDWANRDTFWCANILSPGKLREKWGTLQAKRSSAPAPAAAQRSDRHRTSYDRSADRAAMDAYIVKLAEQGIDVSNNDFDDMKGPTA